MQYVRFAIFTIVVHAVLGGLPGVATAQDELVDLVLGLLSDNDKDVRALAFEQVRSEVPGEAATLAFAKHLPKLPADAQAGLLNALGDRGDIAAAPAVRGFLSDDQQPEVRTAAIRALGQLGGAEDLDRLIRFVATGSAEDRSAARRSLVVLPGDEVSADLATKMTDGETSTRVMLLDVLRERRARNTIPAMLQAAVADDADVRRAAMTALGELAGLEHISGMVDGILKAQPGRERDAAEKAVMFVSQRTADADQGAAAVLEASKELSGSERMTLLSTLGRIGGPTARQAIEEAVSSDDAALHDAGLRALCNWPDATIAFRLLELARREPSDGHRRTALRSLVRVAPLTAESGDPRSLDFLRTAMAMCREDVDRLWVIERARAVRSVDSLHFLERYLDRPPYVEAACLSIVELAHYSDLREANKAEFHRVLDRVIEISQDATVVDRAQRYQRGQTWVRPKSG